MKLIKQSFELIQQEDYSIVSIKKFIERCGRLCYKSEDRITDTSYISFVDMLEKKDHSRVLEMGTVHLRMSKARYEELREILCDNNLYNSVWMKYRVSTTNITFITLNYRYYLEIIKLLDTIKSSFDIESYFTTEDNIMYPKRVAVHFITNRAIMDEFRTHVTFSSVAESTRYCNFSLNKFNNEITFIKPYWCQKLKTGYYNVLDYTLMYEGKSFKPTLDDNSYTLGNKKFIRELCNIEEKYLRLIQDYKYKPQEARDILPLSVKSEVILCGFLDAWDNFFYRRCAKDAHPMARELALQVEAEFKEHGFYYNFK